MWWLLALGCLAAAGFLVRVHSQSDLVDSLSDPANTCWDRDWSPRPVAPETCTDLDGDASDG
ncbi:hypothetical protein [Actinomadura sp. 21ATH]|uniref:hypothetical protein n=1 Tax=Actinomadura sp. 21ATH TaxID=1735444 RepID=UPI0035BF448E